MRGRPFVVSRKLPKFFLEAVSIFMQDWLELCNTLFVLINRRSSVGVGRAESEASGAGSRTSPRDKEVKLDLELICT